MSPNQDARVPLVHQSTGHHAVIYLHITCILQNRRWYNPSTDHCWQYKDSRDNILDIQWTALSKEYSSIATTVCATSERHMQSDHQLSGKCVVQGYQVIPGTCYKFVAARGCSQVVFYQICMASCAANRCQASTNTCGSACTHVAIWQLNRGS